MYVEKFAARFVMNDKSAQVSAMFHNQRWLFRDLVSIVNSRGLPASSKSGAFTLMPSGARSKIRASQLPIEITRFFPGLVRRTPPMPATITGASFGTTSHGIAGAFVDGLSQAFIGVGSLAA
jgi:hypothetical protein